MPEISTLKPVLTSLLFLHLTGQPASASPPVAQEVIEESGSAADEVQNGTDAGEGSDTAGIHFTSVASIAEHDSEIAIVNGERVSLKTQTANYSSLTFMDSLANGRCSATLIGPNALLTAEHCLKAHFSKKVPVSLEIGGIAYQMSCVRAAKAGSGWIPGNLYSLDDFALCRTDQHISAGLRFDPLHTGALPMPGQIIHVAGFGSTKQVANCPSAAGGSPVGTLVVADFHIAGHRTDDGYVLPYSASGCSDPYIGPADSGGPVFSQSVAATPEASGRRLVAINSWRQVAKDDTERPVIYSYFAPLASPGFTELVNIFLDKHPDARICGINIQPGYGTGSWTCMP